MNFALSRYSVSEHLAAFRRYWVIRGAPVSQIHVIPKNATYPYGDGGVEFYFGYSITQTSLKATQPLYFRVRCVIQGRGYTSSPHDD